MGLISKERVQLVVSEEMTNASWAHEQRWYKSLARVNHEIEKCEEELLIAPVIAERNSYPKMNRLAYCGQCGARLRMTGKYSRYCDQCGSPVGWEKVRDNDGKVPEREEV